MTRIQNSFNDPNPKLFWCANTSAQQLHCDGARICATYRVHAASRQRFLLTIPQYISLRHQVTNLRFPAYAAGPFCLSVQSSRLAHHHEAASRHWPAHCAARPRCHHARRTACHACGRRMRPASLPSCCPLLPSRTRQGRCRRGRRRRRRRTANRRGPWGASQVAVHRPKKAGHVRAPHRRRHVVGPGAGCAGGCGTRLWRCRTHPWARRAHPRPAAHQATLRRSLCQVRRRRRPTLTK